MNIQPEAMEGSSAAEALIPRFQLSELLNQGQHASQMDLSSFVTNPVSQIKAGDVSPCSAQLMVPQHF